MLTIEIVYAGQPVVLHIPDGWDVFAYRGDWYVKNESGTFIGVSSRMNDGTSRLNAVTGERDMGAGGSPVVTAADALLQKQCRASSVNVNDANDQTTEPYRRPYDR